MNRAAVRMTQIGFFEPTLEEIEAEIDGARNDVDNKMTDFTVEIMVSKMRENAVTGEPADIDIPDYQRPFVWSRPAQSKYVESLFLNLPVPYLFLAQRREDGRLEVVDGSQRLRTLDAFLHDELVLEGLEKLGILNGLRFSDLPTSQQRVFRNSAVKTVVFSAKADESTRFDVFQRINAEGMRLSDAQIRRGAYKGPFYDLVLRCASKARFMRMCRLSGRNDSDSERAELVLRFFAYSNRYEQFVHDVARFLNEFVKEMNRDPILDIDALERDFEAMLDYVERNFKDGFRKGPNSSEIPRVRFEAISVGVHLARKSDGISVSPDTDWLYSDEFTQLTRTDASNSSKRLRARVEFVRDRLMDRA